MPYAVKLAGFKTHPDGIQTDSYHVDYTRAKDGKVFPYLVDLYSVEGKTPHGYEATRRDEDSDGNEYFTTGSLSIEANVLEDYDGTAFLPKCVYATLRHLGHVVSDNCLIAPLA